MNYRFKAAILLFAMFFSACDTLNQTAQQILNQSLNPSSAEIAGALKQALETGTSNGANRLSAQDGFFGNMAIRILFPPEAQKVENTLRSIGLGKVCDEAILSLNRAAERAALEAKPIFVSAIKQMTINDAVNILLGKQNDAATQYFKRVTTLQLTDKFKPIIASSLNTVGATRHWGTVITNYNKIPLVTRINPDLEAYVTERALEGLFYEIAKEELQIRSSISARTTPLMQKVFGYADRQSAG